MQDLKNVKGPQEIRNTNCKDSPGNIGCKGQGELMRGDGRHLWWKWGPGETGPWWELG